MVPKNDSILFGVLVGIVVTVAGYYIARSSSEWIAAAIDRPFTFKDSTIFIIAICMNMLPMGYFRRRYYNKSLRGIMFFIMGLVSFWFVQFGTDLLNG